MFWFLVIDTRFSRSMSKLPVEVAGVDDDPNADPKENKINDIRNQKQNLNVKENETIPSCCSPANLKSNAAWFHKVITDVRSENQTRQKKQRANDGRRIPLWLEHVLWSSSFDYHSFLLCLDPKCIEIDVMRSTQVPLAANSSIMKPILRSNLNWGKSKKKKKRLPSSDEEIRRKRSWCYQCRKDHQDRVEALRDQNALQFWPTQLPYRRVVLTLTSGAIHCSTKCSFFLPSTHPAFSSSSSSLLKNFLGKITEKRERRNRNDVLIWSLIKIWCDGEREKAKLVRRERQQKPKTLSFSLSITEKRKKREKTNFELSNKQYLIPKKP